METMCRNVTRTFYYDDEKGCYESAELNNKFCLCCVSSLLRNTTRGCCRIKGYWMVNSLLLKLHPEGEGEGVDVDYVIVFPARGKSCNPSCKYLLTILVEM